MHLPELFVFVFLFFFLGGTFPVYFILLDYFLGFLCKAGSLYWKQNVRRCWVDVIWKLEFAFNNIFLKLKESLNLSM